MTINQNQRFGYLLTTLNCTFSETINYRIDSVRPDVRFLYINSTSGELRLAVNAIDIQPGAYLVNLVCLYQSRSTDTTLSVFRIEENEFSPAFRTNVLELTFLENTTVSSLIAQVMAYDDDIGIFGEITYAISTPGIDSHFMIQPNTGRITLLSPLDFEQNTEHQFFISASNRPSENRIQSSSILVTINVEDVDDTSPIFDETNYRISLLENYTEPANFLNVRCTDTDTDNARLQYGISSDGSGPFQLNSRTGQFTIMRGGLDYETTTFYSFEITCFDNSLLNSSSTVRVDISILPVNEEHPTFYKTVSRFPILLNELSPVGMVIVSTLNTTNPSRQYAARDIDSGPDGNITFTLNNDLILEYFRIDLITGEVTIQRMLDFDSDNNSLVREVSRGISIVIKSFTITACDMFPPPPDSLCPNMLVHLILRPINEFPPQFSQEEYDISVPESLSFDELVLRVSCTDNDRVVGIFRDIDFINASQSVLDSFVIVPTTGEILVNSSLDYESVTNYGFHLRCRDTGGLEDTALVIVEILPVNDNFPSFTQALYQFNVSRTAPSNRYPIGRVLATDDDVGLGGNLFYHVQPNPFFDIASDGTVLLINSIQNETIPGIRFEAIVYDGPNITFNRDATLVSVTFTDGNVNRPQFELGSRVLEVSELLSIGSDVTTIHCIDSEFGLNGIVRYSIQSGNTDSIFTIDSATGVISVAAVLTLPQNASSEEYPLTVVCEDLGVPRLSDRAAIFIRVLRDDSSPPVISNSTIFTFVDENATLNTPIVLVEATDLDSESLHFDLENESHPGVFIIDPPSGQVLLAAALDRETVSVYYMTVVVTEQRNIPGPEKSDRAQLTVLVRDVNDNSPICTQTSLAVTIPDTVLEGDSILTLSCSDPDVGNNGNLTYSLLDDFGVLAIDNSGNIYLNDSLAFVDRNFLGLEVLVSDQGLPVPRSNSYPVTIQIASTNHNIPSFLNLPNSITLPESQSIQQVIFTVMADDPDRGVFGQLTYRIASNSDSNEFEISPNTGSIILRSRLNFFDQQQYILNITVEDSDYVVSDVLLVSVVDVNEFSPTCEETRITAILDEGLPGNQALSPSLDCFDEDQGSNGRLIYRIISGNDTVFSVSNNGTIIAQESLDFEQVQRYSLVLVISDEGEPPLAVNASVIVLVRAVNEHTPSFTMNFYATSIPEDATVSTSIITVHASDGDLSTHRDGQIVYSISGTDFIPFTVSTSGLLQVAGDLDREDQQIFSLMVIASDRGVPPRSTQALINITLTDVDDNPPMFSQIFYSTTYNQSDNAQDSILTVLCDDPDSGPNAAVVYTLDTTSSDAQLFQISNNGGVIQVNGVLTVSRIYSFRVMCTNPFSGRFDTAIVTIQAVADTNITFHPSNSYTRNVTEDTRPVYDLVTISASSSTNASLSYSLLSSNPLFHVDGSTGILRLIGILDYETDQSFTLRVQASDNGVPPNLAEAVVNVIVENVNDEAPVILTIPPVLNLTEGPTVRTEALFDFECSDNDDGSFGEVSFHIEEGELQNSFAMSASGTLSLIGDIDYETSRSFSLDIVCEDGGHPAMKDSIPLFINVLPVNDNPPEFQQDVVTIEVDESVPIFSIVGDIVALDADLPPHNNIHYSIMGGNTIPPTFEITSTSGQLTLIRSLDFETVHTYSLVVLAEDSGGNQDPGFSVLNDTINVVISIRDVNDNTPTFSMNTYTGNVAEEAGTGAQVVLGNGALISCTDRDFGSNGDTYFNITDSSIFQIHPSSGIVTAIQNLNFETQPSYTLSIQCIDRGTPPMSAVARLFVTVTDVNEFSPRFTNETGYSFSVLESTLIGDEIGMILAVDEDAGDAGIVSYSFINGTDDLFNLNPVTGVITLSSSLDFETQPHQYFLQALARDNAGNSNEAAVIVNIINVDDHLPLFSMNLYFFSVRENVAVDTAIGHITCSDADNAALGILLMYTISNSSFAVDTNRGELTVAEPLDLESVPRYSINAMCIDTVGNTASANITINLLPFNDFPPVFIQSHYNASVEENTILGTSIHQVRATDDDINEYFNINYTIVSGNDAGLFSIDSASGVLRVNGNIDRENAAEHVLILQAQNLIPPADTSGSSPLSSTATILIDVLDVNDNYPVISPGNPPPIFILESDGPSAFVLQLTCLDLDDGVNGMTSLSIMNPGSRERFQISNNGTLRTTTIIRSDEVVTVSCRDSGNPSLLSSVDISVSTMSENNHAPMFDSANYTIQVAEDTPVGRVVSCINATDRDGTDTLDGIIEYSLFFLGSDVSKFGIMRGTGCIFVSIALDFDVTMYYEYRVIATDMGIQPLQGNTTLFIEIIDAIRDPPRFQSDSYTRLVPENAPRGSLIAQVTCLDPDVDDMILYSIADPTSQFTVDPVHGNVTLATNLDFEVTESHTLRVICNDTFGLQDQTDVSVTVLPINEYPPSFFSATVDIEENSVIGRIVTTLVWMDSDDGLDGEVDFSILAGNVNSAFSITSTGTVLVRSSLDRESLPAYFLNVSISDRSVNDSRSSVGQLNVTILDINDNRPHFTSNLYMFGPLEGNETVGSFVGRVSCSDDDTGFNALTSFHISSDNNNFTLFAIDAESGVITVNGDLQTRELDTIAFTVLCTDSGIPTLAGISRVLVRVEEINRYAPEFLNSSYIIRVPEDTPILEETILTVHADDRDTGINGEVRYYLHDTLNDRFFINEITGEVSLIWPLDFEQQSLYTVTVIARDGAVDSILRLRSAVNITIEVTGVNEHNPQCQNAIYVGIINATSQGTILDFLCTDNDGGHDGQLTYNITSGNENKYFIAKNDSLLVPKPFYPVNGSEQFMLQVSVRDMGEPSRNTSIDIVIIYSFDNLDTPEFDQSLYSINVSELTEVGTVVTTLMATDTDPSLQGEITYSVRDTDNFRIDANSGDLFLATPLDWETLPSLAFTVVAEDRDPSAPRFDTATVNISVINENDNPPKCNRILYTGQVLSNTSVGDTILTLNCTDLDRNQLHYSIISSIISVFGIDSNTGRVFVAGRLTEISYLVDVGVFGDNGERTTISISIATLFSNQEPPVFNFIEYIFTVSEAASLLTTIASVQATDADSNINDLRYSLVDPGMGEFSVNPSTGDIILTIPLDFEVIEQYVINVSVSDGGSFDGSNVLSSTVLVIININNTNDNTPVFSNGGIYGRTIPETTPVNTSILTITCTDNDAFPFGSPSITSEGFSNIPFVLTESSTGEARVSVSDSLVGPNAYFVNVTCSDGQTDIKGQIFIFVPEPLAPMFSQPVYEWFISESASTGSVYRSIQATSNDQSEITYSFSDGNNDDIFYIDPSSGVISLVLTLDYETQRRHGLIVRSVDESNRESNVLLLVQVLDANDELPLTPPSALLTIQQNERPGYPVGTVECIDADVNINHTVFNYTFNPESSHFSIDEFGIIRLEVELDNTPVYVLPVVCFDVRDPQINSTGIVTIEVDFVNLHRPIFQSPRYTFRVSEAMEALSSVGVPVTATDDDIGSFSQLIYDIEGDQDQFFIESETGRIGLLTALDREIQDLYTLTVIATDGGPSAPERSRMTGSTTVTITVEDSNDNPPSPSQLSYVQSININHMVRSPVLSVSCSDPDLGSNGTVMYSLSPVDTLNNFIVQSNGTILLAQEQPNQAVYSFFVICSDRGNIPLNSSALVTVTVNFIALSAPVFDEDHYNVSILENTTVTTVIAGIHATPSDVSITVIYNLVGGNDRTSFFVNSVTGEVSVRNPLDARQQQYYTLTVSAGNSGSDQLFSFATISIFVEDINDNSPYFESQFYTSTVNERATLLTPVVQVSCNDSDVNSDISYTVTGLSGPPAFNITRSGLVTVAGEIDYESIIGYSFQVTCSDGGREPRTAVTTVRINVLPINEFSPQFTRSEYSFKATENDFGTHLGRVEARDGDSGVHGSVTYLLQDPGNFSVVFVDPTTGDVLVSNNLDYEAQTVWNLTVIARDGGGLESSVPLNIQVMNVNDVPPVLEPETSVHNISVDEEPGTPIQSYACSDQDSNNSSLFIASGNLEGYFDLRNNIIVWTGRASNLTANYITSFTLHCQDNAATEQYDEAVIAVNIVVTDATLPLFSEQIYSVSIAEDTLTNTTILAVFAAGENTEVVYHLLSLSSVFPFAIDASEGNITLVRTLDHETESFFSFLVTATDPITGAIGFSLVEVTVIDINDNRPIITPTMQSILLPENFDLSTSFISFVCADSDTGSNGNVDFQIGGGNILDTFSIDNNGFVSLAHPLDFELISNFTLEIRCNDSAEPPLSDVATLLVSVDGFNEYSPMFTNLTYSFSVSEFTQTGDVIGTVNASDLDAGPDGTVIYSVLSGSGVDFFTLAPNGSIITSILPLNATDNPTLQLNIRATDSGLLHNDAVVIVMVEDVNEPPLFSGSGNYFVRAETNLSPGSSILQFTCYDTDIGRNSLVDITISSLPAGLNLYLLTTDRGNAEDGQLIINSSLPAGSYELNITCSDGGNPSMTSTTSVTVRVDSLNTPPVFSQDILSFVVPENIPVGSPVFTVNAIDAETGVVYSITGGTGLGSFQIDNVSGLVTTSLPLDYEITQTYSLMITASDLSLSNQMSVSIQIFVIIINVNDLAPTLSPGIRVVTLSEDSSPMTIVESYTCSDLDGTSATLSISSLDAVSPFDIAPSGAVFLRMSVDYEQSTVHYINVTCTDEEVRNGEGTVMQTTSLLTVIVLPVNLHAPVFTSQSFFDIAENATVGDIVGRVEAFDGDQRGFLTFSSSSHTDIFLVDSRGNIMVLAELDFETTSDYSLTILVNDNDVILDVEPRTNSTIITIRLIDVNDNQPMCVSNVIRANFETGDYTDPPILLAQLNCTDLDNGLNGLLRYSIVEDTLPNIALGSFIVNERSGELRFQGTIDVSGSHVIEVFVEDSGFPLMHSTVSVVIQVENSDDTRPRFNQTVFRVDISENTLSPSVILSGLEIRENFINPLEETVEYSFQASVENNGVFIINNINADITLVDNKLIDYDEGRRQYVLILEARTRGIDTAIVEITVSDFNDNPPIFLRSIFNGSVPENQPPRTYVLHVEATDTDSTENGLFRYSIQGTSSALAVDPFSGNITTTQRFDRESNERYTIVVLATDMGIPPLTGSTTVTVSVTDLNDSPPSFVDSIYIISINNTIQPGEVIVTLRAEDEDEVGTLTYFIDSEEVRHLFLIDFDGVLRLRTIGLPHDHLSRYNFTVVVSDGHGVDRAIVIIYVVSLTTDTVLFEENEEQEQYDARAFLLQNFNLSTNAVYEIIQGDPFNQFDINSNGILSLSQVLDRENMSRYELTIRILDDVTAVNIELLVTVTVLDQNDNAPIFGSDVYMFNVSEGPYQDSVTLGHLTATDLDQPGTSASTIEYSFPVPHDAFTIDPSSGEVILKGGVILDRENSQNITILVQARDFGEPSALHTDALLVMFLEDINDNDPEFIPLATLEYFVLLSEEKMPPNTRLDKITVLLPKGIRNEVRTISVMDPDSSSRITASLEGAEGQHKFGIIDAHSPELELVTTEELTKADFGTVLQIVLRDEPIDEEDNPVIRNISFVGSNDFFGPNPGGVLPAPPFFQTEVGVAIIVVICLVIVVLLVSLFCILCYLKGRGEKDQLDDAYVLNLLPTPKHKNQA